MALDLQEHEYMTLAQGVGIVPEKFRNRGYSKLDYAAGEGGIGTLLDAKPAGDSGAAMNDFLAAVASGADPKEFAANLLATKQSGRRGRQA